MSRSYKHFPYCNYRSTKVKRELRRHYNRRLRRLLKNPEIQCNGSQFKKWSRDDWDLFCGSYWTLKSYLKYKNEPYYSWKDDAWIVDVEDEKELVNRWKKWYYRK